jgi:predicted RNA-binding protein YlxR (DUF448 family)
MRSQVMRMCVSCRVREAQEALIRVVCAQGRLMADNEQKASGRGAYVHPTAECINNALSRRMFVRALRVKSDVDVKVIAGLANGENQPSTTA